MGVRLTKLSWATKVVNYKKYLQRKAVNKLEDKNFEPKLGNKTKDGKKSYGLKLLKSYEIKYQYHMLLLLKDKLARLGHYLS